MSLTFSPWNDVPCSARTIFLSPPRISGVIVTTAFFLMYLAGNLPFTVTVTFPPRASIGSGVTSKFDAVSCCIFDEHDAVKDNTDAAIKYKVFLRITNKVFIKKMKSVPRAGLEPAQPFLAKGF